MWYLSNHTNQVIYHLNNCHIKYKAISEELRATIDQCGVEEMKVGLQNSPNKGGTKC